MRYRDRFLKISAVLLTLCLCITLVSCGSDIGVQKPTDQLTICLGPYNKTAFDTALSLFKEKFPDINVTVRDFGLSMAEVYADVNALTAKIEEVEDFGEILGTEMMADSGPDLLIWDQNWDSGMAFFNDLTKTVNTGVFADINPYIEADSEFNPRDFVSGVFDAGMFDGKRYFVPLGYNIPGILTTRNTLELWGIDMPEKPTWEEFAVAYNQAYEKAKNDGNKWIELDNQPLFYVVCSGIEFLDYENRKSIVDFEQFKTFYDDIHPGVALMTERIESDRESGVATSSAGLGANLFLMRTVVGDVSYDLSKYSRYNADDMIQFAVPQVNGGAPLAFLGVCAAIRGGSDSQYNAYEFIKLLLSNDAQSVFDLANYDFKAPVRANSIIDKINNVIPIKEGLQGAEEISLSEQWIEDYMSILSDVEYNYIAPHVVRIVEETMAPYVEGTSSYEECFEELEKELNFYVSE